MSHASINQLQPFDEHDFDTLFDRLASGQPQSEERLMQLPTVATDRRTDLCNFIACVVFPEYGASAQERSGCGQHGQRYDADDASWPPDRLAQHTAR